MKNIAILVPSLKSGGAEKQAALLAKLLSKNYQVSFFVFYGSVVSSETNTSILKQGSSIRVYYLMGSSFKKTKELYGLLKSNKIDVVFNYLTHSDVYGAIVEKMSGVGTIYNGIRNSRLPKIKMIFERFSHNHIVSGTIFNCYSGVDYFKSKGFKSNGCVVIQNCFPNIAEPMTRINHSTNTIVTVGRFVEQKDYETSLRAIALLKQKGASFHYIIVGYGELENRIRNWIDGYGINDNVTLFINPSNTQEILKSADIYLSTSIFEGTSNSIMEAMNWSIPVVATNVGDNEYLIKNNHNGFLCPIGDVKGLANNMAFLIDNADVRNKMGINGNTLLRECFSEASFGQKYQSLIEQLVF